jgi:hypothetical protein
MKNRFWTPPLLAGQLLLVFTLISSLWSCASLRQIVVALSVQPLAGYGVVSVTLKPTVEEYAI